MFYKHSDSQYHQNRTYGKLSEDTSWLWISLVYQGGAYYKEVKVILIDMTLYL